MKYYSIKGLIIDIEFHAEVSSARSHSEFAFLFHLFESLLPQEEDAVQRERTAVRKGGHD